MTTIITCWISLNLASENRLIHMTTKNIEENKKLIKETMGRK